MPRVAIVIVTWNSEHEIEHCLDSVSDLRDVEFVVVDNASADTTCERVRRKGLALIANSTNVGFAAAVNQGIRATDAPLILLLNPDTRLMYGLDVLLGRFEDPLTGAAGGLLVGADGMPQTGFMVRQLPTPAALVFEALGINRLWPNNPVNWHYRCKGFDPMKPAVVDQPAGAFLMFPRRVWEIVGGFDERYWPIWFEDVDFCARIKAAGFRVVFDPKACARHQGSHSIRLLPLENRERYWYRSLLEYAARHYHSVGYRAICLAVAAGAVARAAATAPSRGRKAFAVYGNVIGLALRRLFSPRRGSRGTAV
jgi:N-acetylglucosaminyl-diphospho-decaprenol L-rhamnosyltransferase